MPDTSVTSREWVLILVIVFMAARALFGFVWMLLVNALALTMRPGKDYYETWRWRCLRSYVMWREHRRCQVCNQSKSKLTERHIFLDTHHIIPIRRGGSHFTINLMLACRVCHSKIHGRQLW